MGLKPRAARAPVRRPRAVRASRLAAAIAGARIVGDDTVTASAVTDDSRQAGTGTVFVAVRGLRSDGHDFVRQAAERGAPIVVVEREIHGIACTQIICPNSGPAFGELAALFAGSPASALVPIGITGTNGKTTTTFLIESILDAAGGAPGIIGTVSYRYGGATYDAPYTTPTPLVLQETLAKMANAGCAHAVLEVSSAALEMDRLAGVPFRVAAFTNLTQDHLEVHGSMEKYRAAKERLFRDHLAPDGIAVINIDDPASAAMIDAAGEHEILRVSASGRTDADVRVVSMETSIAGISANIAACGANVKVSAPALLGRYNVDNLAMAVAIATALKIPARAIVRGIRQMRGVPGRVERVANDRGLDILVDYAHTPDALVNVLTAMRPLVRRRLICVFGCGGDRDPSKRPLMGKAVSELADLAVVTSDNPRTEDPQSIIDMILPAVPEPFFVDTDRRTAIRAAVCEATPGDIVVIAGKGHEDYQILGTEKIHFDDREEAAEAAVLRPAFTVAEILEATDGELVRGKVARFDRVVIDGRSATQGDLYVAIRGERFDGHEFCEQAVRAGASGVLVARERAREVGKVLKGELSAALILAVDDPRNALGALARFHRQRWNGTLIAVTGSAGKTTTKDLLATCLRPGGRVHTSAGSLNNETGVPLTILGIRPFHDFAVVEMGMRGLGQIAELCAIAEPDIGIVTNAGTAHVGVVGSAEAIVQGKAEMFSSLRPDGVAVFPADDERLAKRAARAAKSVSFGESAFADVRLIEHASLGSEGSRLMLDVYGDELEATLPLVGQHNAMNATCAVAAAVAAGVPAAHACAALRRARPPALRGELREVEGRRVLVDCYNANPAAMTAALETLADLVGSGRGLAVLGDMLELGDDAALAHLQAGALAASLGLTVIALGDHRQAFVSGARDRGGQAEAAESPDEAARAVLSSSEPGDWILLKASRGMKLERVLLAMESKRLAPDTSQR